jgi:hypothetical protein
VEAVLNHRLVLRARGRGRQLEYLVRWEGARGDEPQRSWELAHLLQVCEQQLEEYWATAMSRGGAIAHEATPIVKERVLRARRRAGAVPKATTPAPGPDTTLGIGGYTLPPGMIALPQRPSKAQQMCDAFKELHLMYLWQRDKGMPSEHLRWSEATILALPARRKLYHRVQYLEDGSVYNHVLDRDVYGTDPATRVHGTFFAFGTAEQVAAVLAVGGT